ncbi:MAG: C40 family peptidase [Bacteroidales bacterium]|nr:C40 family peptidase [Bacteroidales bacterium]
MVKRILSAVIAAFAVGLAAEAQEKRMAELEKRMAVVELSTIYMRQQPDYESALETQELMGTVVEIVGEQGYWREIVSPQPYRAWATEKGLVEMAEEELKAYEEAPKVMFTGLYGHIYMEPSFKAATLCDLVGGDLLRLAEDAENGAGKGDGAEAVLQNNKIKLKGKWTEVMLPSGRKGHVPTKELKPHYGFMSIAQGEGNAGSIDAQTTEAIIAQAEKLLGSPYLWGGMSAKGVDCSGLVRISHIMNGILLPRNASQQINCGDRVPMPVNPRFWDDRSDAQAFKEEMLARVQNLRRGDLVFFGTPASEPGKKPRITHVGIYLGEGRIIHSSHMVRINSLIPGEADYYENAHRLIAAIRL